MKYFMLDYICRLKEINKTEYLRRMSKTNTPFVVYDDDHYILITDSANDVEIIKKAILEMLQPFIYFDIE